MAVNAQVREAGQVITFEKKSGQITTAKGWYQNPQTKTWVENQNVCYFEASPTAFATSLTEQNFKTIEMATCKHANKRWYVLIVEKAGGEYKYPALKEQWQPDNRKYWFAIDSTQYVSLKATVNDKKGVNLNLTATRVGYISDKAAGGLADYTNEYFMKRLSGCIINREFTTKLCIMVNAQTTEGKDVVRFTVLRLKMP
ncbi:MAG: hypothetical protein M0D57_17985 [Sphingobacteriales bacterium JAD_PAG50586_3]|nr:MAG: hypothetical protein M0D57_17985 [Sphingobacteriales bacterium JAD_PAG50586_3]